jgi:DNA repair protein RadC
VDYRIPIYRVSLVREGEQPLDTPKIRSSADVSTLLHAHLKDVDREHFVVVFVDQKNHIVGLHTVSVGSLTASVVHPRETFKAAIWGCVSRREMPIALDTISTESAP